MEIRTRIIKGSFIELKTDQQETNCFDKKEALEIIEHLLDVINDLSYFIDDKN